MASKARQKRFVDDAALQALIKFGPQLDVLKQAQRTAQSQFTSQVAEADAGRVGVQQAVDAVVPGLAGVYEGAGLDAARTSRTLIGQDLAGLGGVANSIKAGSAMEAAGMAGRLGQAKTQAFTDLAQRRVGAATGAVTAKRQARSQLVDNLAKILQTEQDLLGQKGTFQAGAVADAINKDLDRTHDTNVNNADNSQSERNSLRTAGIDPDTLKPIPNGKLDPKAKKPPKPATPGQHGKFKDAVSTALQIVKDAKADGTSREDILHDLTTGVGAQTFRTDPVTGKKLKVPIHDPGVPKTNPLVAQIAAEMVFDVGLSQATVDELHKRRYKVKTLGLRTKASLNPAQRSTISASQTLADLGSLLAGG